MRHTTRLALGLAGALSLAALPALAQTKWNLPAAYPADNFHTENLSAFAKDVADATGNKLQITVHPPPRCLRHRRSSARCRPARRRSARC
jgi:TRAP-type C4-dicarboxylate transport system substrate-binding protein